MMVPVRIFGNLRETVEGYDPVKGMELDIKKGSTAGDLLARLHILGNSGAIVVQNNQVKIKTDTLDATGEVRILQPLHGG